MSRKTKPPSDWPSAAAKFVAAGLLGIAAIVGIGLSRTRVPIGTPLGAPIGEGVAADPQRGSATVASGESPEATHPAPETKAAEMTFGRLDLNRATQAELEMLPGVGPALAKRIIADRDSNGRFESVQQLDRVKGIGPRMIERLRGMVKVE